MIDINKTPQKMIEKAVHQKASAANKKDPLPLEVEKTVMTLACLQIFTPPAVAS
jgi:hypothetical protein